MKKKRKPKKGEPPEFTKTEKKLLKLFADAKPHTKDEIAEALEDPLMYVNGYAALYMHIRRIRKKLNKIDQTIICVYANHRLAYQQLRLLYPSNPNSAYAPLD